MTMEMYNPSPNTGIESRYGEFDEKLGPIFERFQNEGKIVDGKISGNDYTKLQQEVEAKFPDMKASIFNPYLFDHRCIMIYGNPKQDFKTAPWSTSKIVTKPSANNSSHLSHTSEVSFKNRAAGDDTPDLLKRF